MKRYQVFISSTFSDLRDAREKVLKILLSIDCIPSGMEFFPASDDEQFEFIKRIIDDCDYYLLIVGGRYGSVASDGISYTQKEYEYALSKGIPVIAFLRNNIDKLPVCDTDGNDEKRKKLETFREQVSRGRMIRYWDTEDELASQVAVSLPQAFKLHPAAGWVRGGTGASEETLLKLLEANHRIAELENQIRHLQSKATMPVDSLPSLAEQLSLDSEVKLTTTFEVKYQDSDTWDTEYVEHTICLRDLYDEIAPSLISPMSERDLRDLINRMLDTDDLGEKITGHDFDTLKLNFLAMQLIDISAEGEWCLTAKGREVMYADRLVRKNETQKQELVRV